MDWKLVPEVTNGVGGNNALTGVTTTWVLVCIVLRVHQLHNRVQLEHGQCLLALVVLKIISCPGNIVRRVLKDGHVRGTEYIM